jgi:hypothetical protein
VLVTSFAEFMLNFGGFLPIPSGAIYNQWAPSSNVEGGQWWHFPLSVKGYFDNGGQQLYVKRVFSSTATPSAANLGGGMVSEIVADAAANATVLQLRHLIDIDLNSQLQIFRGDTGAAIGANFGVNSYNPTTNQVTLAAQVPAAVIAKRGDYVQIQPIQPPGANPTLTFTAAARGNWSNDLSVQVRPMVGNIMNILPDPTIPGNNPAVTTVVQTVNAAGPPATTTVTVQSVAGFNNVDHILVNGREFVINDVAAGPPATFTITPALAAAQSWAAGTAVRRLGQANTPGAGPVLNVWGASSLYNGAIVELDNGRNKETFTVLGTAANQVTLSGNPAYYETQKLRVIEAEVDVSYQPANSAAATETFTNLRLVDDGSASNLVKYVNQQSMYVTVAEGAGYSSNQLTRFPIAQNGSFLRMGGG